MDLVEISKIRNDTPTSWSEVLKAWSQFLDTDEEMDQFQDAALQFCN
jgi:hypothetical protein